MTSDSDPTASLSALVHHSLANGVSALEFGKQFRQYKHKALASNQPVDISPLYTDCSRNPVQLTYIFQVVVRDDLNNSLDDLSELFVGFLPKMARADQTGLMIYLNQMADEIPWDKMAANPQFLAAFWQYLHVFSKSSPSPQRDAKMTLMVTKFVVHLLSCDTKMPETFNQQVPPFLSFLKESHFYAAYDHLHSFYSQYNLLTVRRDYQTAAPGTHSTVNTVKMLRMRKILWLSQQFTVKFVPVNDKFILSFKKLLNLSRLATAATNTSIAYELTVSVFDCLELSTVQTHSLWTHAILYKLPQAFQLLSISQGKLANTLANVYEGLGESQRVLLKGLVTNLVDLKLVKREDFKETMEIQTVATNVDELRQTYTELFHTQSASFFSIEESGVTEFITKASQSLAGLQALGQLALESIDTFIAEKDSMKLRRLLIALCIRREVFDYVMLQQSPYLVGGKLISYLEGQVEVRPSDKAEPQEDDQAGSTEFLDLDLDDVDEGNAQDVLTDFGTVLIFLQYALFRFNMNLWKFEKDDQRALELLNNASTVNSKDYLVKLQDPDSELNAVINDWIRSLFDTVNTDGISDDLVKRCSLRDYHFIMPRVIEEAMTAYSLSLIDEDAMMGGLEYFYQPFLLNNLTTIFRYLLNACWSKEDQNDIVSVTKVLRKLSVADEMSGEVRLLHSLIMEIVNDDLYNALTGLNSLSQVEEYLSKLRMPDQCAVNMRDLIEYVTSGTPTKFEISSVYKIADSTGAELDWFYNQLTDLLQIYAGKEPQEMLSYEMIASMMIYYSSFETCTNLGSWVSCLNSYTEDNEQELIFNRTAAKELRIVDSPKPETDQSEDTKPSTANGEMSFESNFFGFIQEPKDDNDDDDEIKVEDPDAMDVDKEDKPVVVAKEPEHDLFMANLLVIIRCNDSKTVNGLMTRILSNLECL